MAERVRTPYEGTRARAWVPGESVGAPLRLHSTTVPPEWVDYNRHMSESCYLLAFGDNADAFFRFVGVDEDYRAAGRSLFTLETHLHHLGEAAGGDPLAFTLQLLDCDAKRLHVLHQMMHAETGAILATAEQLLVNVDTDAHRSAPFPAELAARLEAVRRAHDPLPVPELVGRPLGIRRGP